MGYRHHHHHPYPHHHHPHHHHHHLFYSLLQVRHIGHEIRTPLNVVGVGVDMLIKELEPHLAVLPDSVMDILEGIQDEPSELSYSHTLT